MIFEILEDLIFEKKTIVHVRRKNTCNSFLRLSIICQEANHNLLRFSDETLSNEVLQEMRKKFYADPKNILAQNAGARASPFEVAISRKEVAVENQIFSHKIELEGKPPSNQKSTGRCWLFALLNIMRIPFMKRYNLEEFEFSHTYLFFWDKVCNWPKFCKNFTKFHCALQSNILLYL